MVISFLEALAPYLVRDKSVVMSSRAPCAVVVQRKRGLSLAWLMIEFIRYVWVNVVYGMCFN